MRDLSFADRLHDFLNRDDVLKILYDVTDGYGDWGAGGCFILADALVQFIGVPAKPVGIHCGGKDSVDHVAVDVGGGTLVDYLGARKARTVVGDLNSSTASECEVVPLTAPRIRKAIEADIPRDKGASALLVRKLEEEFGGAMPNEDDEIRKLDLGDNPGPGKCDLCCHKPCVCEGDDVDDAEEQENPSGRVYEAKKAVSALGLTLVYDTDNNEFIVKEKGSRNDSRTSYHTDDLDDAVSTAKAMAKELGIKGEKPVKLSRSDQRFVDFLEETLIPDFKESGSEGYVDDFETAVKYIKDPHRGKVSHWDSAEDFIYYLRETIGPDTAESGKDATADDLFEAADIIEGRLRETQENPGEGDDACHVCYEDCDCDPCDCAETPEGDCECCADAPE